MIIEAKKLNWDNLYRKILIENEWHEIMCILIWQNEIHVRSQHGHVAKFKPEDEVVVLP